MDINTLFDIEENDNGLGETLRNENDEADNCTGDLSDDDEELLPPEPIQLRNTEILKRQLVGQNILAKVTAVLHCMDRQGLNLPLFLDALSWGDVACHADAKVQYARTALMVSSEVPGILARWYKPPRGGLGGKGKRPKGMREVLRRFATEVIGSCVEKELKTSAPLFLSPPEDLSRENLTSIDFNELKKEVKLSLPIYWGILEHAIYSDAQRARNHHKNPDMVILNIISQSQYTRSHRRARIAKLWSIYLKACGLSARAFDAIHALGVTMSHKWAANAYEILSLQAMNSTRAAIRRLPWHISHDNVNIPMRVFSQRLNNQSHFISGCAATVWVLPAIAALPSGANARLQTFRAQHATQIFDFSTVLYGNIDADARIEARNAHHILQVLLNSPEFRDYYAKDDTRFTPPTPTHELPIGSTPDARIQPFILGTCNIEEASYDGTLKVMDEWFRQLHLNSSEEQCRTGRERIIPWLGDQLTVERLRGMWKYRHEDHSSFDRLDYMVPVFGWFHLVMAFANSLHKQYLGTSAGIGGLRQAFDILRRKGLVTQSTKGPFWHHLDEAIQHVSEAHFRASWLIIGNVESLEELKAKSPHELIELSKGLLRKFASREALVEMDEEVPLQLQDQVLKQWTMWNIDILPYLELREAIKVGDIRRMEDLLPTLLFRFAGGGNSKYAIEILELLQGLHCEWPAEIKTHIREWCWLFNQNGKRNGFMPFDMAQEENIADIKVNYHSIGPGATMEYLQKISPAIPTLRHVQRHMEKQFKTTARGAHHGVPEKDVDVQTLTQEYAKSSLYSYKAGRNIKVPSDKALDFVTTGAINLERLGTIDEWFIRRTHERATTEEVDMN